MSALFLPLKLAVVTLFALWGGSALANEREVDAASGIEFVKIPAGCFSMGADRAGEQHEAWPVPMPDHDELPKHEVCVDAFWLSKTEVTRGQWKKVTNKVLPIIDRPVIDVSWDEAVQFTRDLSGVSAGKFRLPTEAEWEYACHAGTVVEAKQVFAEDFFRLLDDTLRLAAYRYQTGRDPTALSVAGRVPNDWGLADMLGNVWEWTLDGYDAAAYARHARHNPLQSATDDRRVIRGGSYKTDIARVRCGARNEAPKDERSPVIGFRVVKEIERSSEKEAKK